MIHSAVTSFCEFLHLSPIASWAAGLSVFVACFLAWALYAALNRWVIPTILRFVEFTEAKWDDIVFNPGILRVMSELAGVIVLRVLVPPALAKFPALFSAANIALRVAIVAVGVHLVNRFILALYNVLEDNSSSRVTSLKGIRQMLQVLTVLVGIIICISILANKDPIAIITGLGAAATILMLVFKDPILGVVAGIQLTLNDMLRPGDWISMPSRGINGTVAEVTLSTVKVLNFDKTILTVPPYSLLTETFQNWRPMQTHGARRITRTITIDTSTVARLDSDRAKALGADVWAADVDLSQPQVNLSLFRRYLEHYLANVPTVTSDSRRPLMVREMQPTPQGLPIEIYLFTTITDWVPYEHLQADIVDHILAAAPSFGLRVYQAPAGQDFRQD